MKRMCNKRWEMFLEGNQSTKQGITRMQMEGFDTIVFRSLNRAMNQFKELAKEFPEYKEFVDKMGVSLKSFLDEPITKESRMDFVIGEEGFHMLLFKLHTQIAEDCGGFEEGYEG